MQLNTCSDTYNECMQNLWNLNKFSGMSQWLFPVVTLDSSYASCYNCRKLNEEYANVSVLSLTTECKSTMPQNKKKNGNLKYWSQLFTNLK